MLNKARPGGYAGRKGSVMKWYEYTDQKNKQKVWWTQRDAKGVCWEIRHDLFSSVFKLYRCGLRVSEWGTLDNAMQAAEGSRNGKTKASVDEALERARKHSLEHPGVTVWVMDKKRQHAVISASEWVHKERILDGWREVAAFRNGEKC